MAAILTRETVGQIRQVNITGDASQATSLAVARGNVAVINRIVMAVLLRAVASTGSTDGEVGLSLDSGLSAATDLDGAATGATSDKEANSAILEAMQYAFGANADTTNGVGAAGSTKVVKVVDYSRLPLLSRPMTSEELEALVNVTNNANAITYTVAFYYQVVQLTQAELGNLAPSILGPSARVVRFADAPQNGGVNNIVVRQS